MENEKVYELFNMLKKRLDKVAEVDMTEVKNLTEELKAFQTETQNYVNQLSEAVEAVHKPIISQRKFTLNLESRGTVFMFIGMLVIIASLTSSLYLATRPNYDRIDNDLKYRYIKMKGEATPQRLIDLEEIFNINRDNTKIRQMQQDVEEYERTTLKKAQLDEQTRLQQQESNKLNQEAIELKAK